MENIKKFGIVIVENEKGEILFGKRKDNNLWTVPAGNIEDNETPLIGALRELKEEVNITVKPTQIKFINEKIVTALDSGERIKLYLYKVKVNSKKINLSSKNDADDELFNNSLKFFRTPLPARILENLHVPRKNNVVVEYLRNNTDLDSITTDGANNMDFKDRLGKLRDLVSGKTTAKTESVINGVDAKEKEIVSTSIEDMGEVILGARKHVASYMSKLEKSKSTTLPMVTPQQLSKMGFNKQNIYMLLMVRAFHKNARRSQKRGMAEIFKDLIQGGNLSTQDVTLKVIDFVGIHHPLKLVNGLEFEQIKVLASIWVTRDGKLAEGKRYFIINSNKTDSFEAVIEDSIQKDEIKANQPKQEKKKAKLDLRWYTNARSDGLFHLGVKITASKFLILKKFETLEDLKEYVYKGENIQDELRAEMDELKKRPITRALKNEPRVGKDYISEGDIAPDNFHAEFPFRGIQFGKWNNNDERQIHLNQCYNAFKDLGGVVDLDNVELTHNGRLSIAFGARGRGGANAPMAHYEPAQEIINLTKRSGAGTLAHEWFHSWDRQIMNTIIESTGFKATMGNGYFSETSYAIKRGEFFAGYNLVKISEELTQLGQLQVDIMDKLRKMDFYQESIKLDSGTKKDYWSSTIEMMARTFEVYVKSSLADDKQRNDYLANVLDSASVYPSKEDMQTLKPMLKELIAKANKWRKENE